MTYTAVAATRVETGVFNPAEEVLLPAGVMSLFNDLLRRGSGYMELRGPGNQYPVLTVGFNDRWGVVQCLRGETESSVLLSEDSADDGRTVDIPIMDESTSFSTDLAVGVCKVRAILDDFTHHHKPPALGQWCDL